MDEEMTVRQRVCGRFLHVWSRVPRSIFPSFHLSFIPSFFLSFSIVAFGFDQRGEFGESHHHDQTLVGFVGGKREKEGVRKEEERKECVVWGNLPRFHLVQEEENMSIAGHLFYVFMFISSRSKTKTTEWVLRGERSAAATYFQRVCSHTPTP